MSKRHSWWDPVPIRCSASWTSFSRTSGKSFSRNSGKSFSRTSGKSFSRTSGKSFSRTSGKGFKNEFRSFFPEDALFGSVTTVVFCPGSPSFTAGGIVFFSFNGAVALRLIVRLRTPGLPFPFFFFLFFLGNKYFAPYTCCLNLIPIVATVESIKSINGKICHVERL